MACDWSALTRRAVTTGFAVLSVATLAGGCAHEKHGATMPGMSEVPAAPREFRAAWVATVQNIDWPSRPGLPVEKQRAEMKAIVDRAAELHLNALVVQVRPAADALYKSKLEPWSVYLTGTSGKAPSPAYDPLKEWVELSHAQGIELHAWFNPFRAGHLSDKLEKQAKNHVRVAHPELVRKYDKYYWMDPGDEAARKHTMKVVLDVVKRYDIDGVHVDDYFYPYPDDKGRPFPDDETYAKYQKAGGTLKRDDWRRDNVNKLMEHFYKDVKKEDKYVKVGISPFGIWKPGYPETIKGFSQYDKLYADVKLWWNNGWMDYLTPQLYWNVGNPPQSYPVLLKWWEAENTMHRHLWPGLYTGKFPKIEQGRNEILDQIAINRGVNIEAAPTTRPFTEATLAALSSPILPAGNTGEVHFSFKSLMKDTELTNALKNETYAKTALVPASRWIDNEAPPAPKVSKKWRNQQMELHVRKPAFSEEVSHFNLYVQQDGEWELKTNGTGMFIVPRNRKLAVSTVDRAGNESPRVYRHFMSFK